MMLKLYFSQGHHTRNLSLPILPLQLFLFTFLWAKFSYLLKWKRICLKRRFSEVEIKFRNHQVSYMLLQLTEVNSPYLHVYTFTLQEIQGMRVRLHAVHFLASSFFHMKPWELFGLFIDTISCRGDRNLVNTHSETVKWTMTKRR